MCTREANHITDTYFLEELSAIIGCSASYEWLRTNSSKKRKFVCSSSPSLSSQSTKKNTPQNSATTSPRRMSLIQSCPLIVSADHQDTSCQRASSRKQGAAELQVEARHTNQRLTDVTRASEKMARQRRDVPEAYPQTEQPSNDNARLEEATPAQRSGRFGLLFTDAAHSVLEDRDVTHYIERTVGCPLP
jgi:hypothetical protein